MENETIESVKELEVADLTEVEETSAESVVTEVQDAQTNAGESVDDSLKNEGETTSQKQSDDENSKYAKARRKAEQESETKSKEAYQRGLEEGRLAAFKGKINPWTNTVIQDLEDLQVYEEMQELEDAGKNPVEDYGSYIAEKNRKAAQEKLIKEQNEKKAKQDIEEFNQKYPNVNLTNLLNDEIFKDYVEGKNKSLCELYDSYTRMQKAFRNKGIDTAKQTIANSMSSPGGLSSGAETVIDYESMSREDFLAEVEKVKEKG